MSIREAIALKRAEAKKSGSKGASGSGLDSFGGLEDALLSETKKNEEDDIVELGRWSVKETIERGRSTGNFGFLIYALKRSRTHHIDKRRKAQLTFLHALYHAFLLLCLKFIWE